MKLYTNDTLLAQAETIVYNAFMHKKDKAGKPYIGHLHRVRDRVDTKQLKIIALLHNLIEDCPEWTEEKLLDMFPSVIVETVVCLTHRKGESYLEYISRIMNNDLAVQVKMADLEDNMDIRRLDSIEDSDIVRLRKYHFSYNRLSHYWNEKYPQNSPQSGKFSVSPEFL